MGHTWLGDGAEADVGRSDLVDDELTEWPTNTKRNLAVSDRQETRGVVQILESHVAVGWRDNELGKST